MEKNEVMMGYPPKKLSELLGLGISSMRGLDRRLYQADHSQWYLPAEDEDGEEVCFVCLAGAVMARVFDPGGPDEPRYHDYEWEACFHALDEIRRGNLVRAAEQMKISADTIPDQLRHVYVLKREFEDWDDADIFLGEMEILRDELKKEGL